MLVQILKEKSYNIILLHPSQLFNSVLCLKGDSTLRPTEMFEVTDWVLRISQISKAGLRETARQVSHNISSGVTVAIYTQNSGFIVYGI